MSGHYPDGISQADIDRALDSGSEEENEQRLINKIERNLIEIQNLLSFALRDHCELAIALRECLEKYCPGCGSGSEGCSTIHHINCRFLKLLEKAEGQKLKLNGQPEII